MARRWFSRSWVSFAWAFLAVGLSIGAWSVSTPLGAAPDEQGHVIEAAAAARGQFTPPKIELVFLGSRKGQIGLVGLPAWVANKQRGRLFHPSAQRAGGLRTDHKH